MFGWFRRNPLKTLEAEYCRLLEKARDLQRAGDIKGFATMTVRAQEVGARIEEVRAKR